MLPDPELIRPYGPLVRRIEAEATDAARQAIRSRVELAAAISAWHQTLGLLPQ